MADSIIELTTAKVCRNCQVANLMEEIKIARCSKCTQLYCVHFASNIDPNYCVECLSNVALHKETIVKTYTSESYDEENDTVIQTQYKRRARSIKLEGMDWVFAQRKIVTMNDDALELALEYHREILQAMVYEREDRRAKKMHRFAGVKPGTETVGISDGTNSTTTVKKSKTISSDKAAATASAMMGTLLNQPGMNAATLLELLKGIQQKGVK